MRLVIVTGMSGAGKSTVLDALEDAGYFCVDNLPIKLLSKFALLCMEAGENENRRFSVGVDIRDEKALSRLPGELAEVEKIGVDHEILFLDASDDALVRRYKETRRSHPLARQGRIEDGIREERARMDFLRKRADHIIDTSHLLVRDLKQEIGRIFLENEEYRDLYITVLSFGFKYGIPTDSDLVFDVRFLPNPYYIEELRHKTGLDREIADYLRSFPETGEFEDRLTEMIRFLIPYYIKEGKNQLVISLGCTGGRHRSVMMAQSLYERLSSARSYGIRVEHRDIGSDAARGK
ncbi:MAG: RNase adapter RapZ [Lachnospiraceae bacterium]|nr:RNase adapter RapZ [Lachnospiraceae bacterium]